jgi:hypothetical protein
MTAQGVLVWDYCGVFRLRVVDPQSIFPWGAPGEGDATLQLVGFSFLPVLRVGSFHE